MKKRAAVSQPETPLGASVTGVRGKVHPVVIFPCQAPEDYCHLKQLFEVVAGYAARRKVFARPITVMDQKAVWTCQDAAALAAFRDKTVAACSRIVKAWCVDTCQMWYTGLGAAYEQGKESDVYWLIPGDFNYAAPEGQEVLNRIHDLPEIVCELQQDLCIGEVATAPGDSKELIDTYGTFALLYLWFPELARQVRELTARPRSEFFAISHRFLGKALRRRWYPYEQTVHLLLMAVQEGRGISRFSVGDITDLPRGQDSLPAALQQIERCERVLKMFWREQHEQEAGWFDRYRQLEILSARARQTAESILGNLLQGPAN